MTATMESSNQVAVPAAPAGAVHRDGRRGVKPRRTGLTQIRGRYYSATAQRRLRDELEIAGPYVDSLEFARGPFSLLRPHPLASVVEICRRHNVAVSSGSLSEDMLTRSAPATDRYIGACRDLGVDIIRLSSRLTSWLGDDWRWLVERIQRAGLTARPTINMAAGQDVDRATLTAQRFLETGIDLIVFESKGLPDTAPWRRTDVATRLIEVLGPECVMLDAAASDILAWYVKYCGPDVNLFVDQRHLAFLERLRARVWGARQPGDRSMP
jgi:phosphosulfolactate synthase (CoM biosynthesis protein A)